MKYRITIAFFFLISSMLIILFGEPYIDESVLNAFVIIGVVFGMLSMVPFLDKEIILNQWKLKGG